MYFVPQVTVMSSFSGRDKIKMDIKQGECKSRKQQWLNKRSPQTWRSVRRTGNAVSGYLGLGSHNEAKLAQKNDQPHCSECGPARKQQNKGNQRIHHLLSRGKSSERKLFKKWPISFFFLCQRWWINLPVHEGKDNKGRRVTLVHYATFNKQTLERKGVKERCALAWAGISAFIFEKKVPCNELLISFNSNTIFKDLFFLT